MLGLAEVFNESLSPARLGIYFAALADLDLDALRVGATTHARTQKFFPRPSELRDAVYGAVEDRADLAWNAVLRLVRRHGYYNPPPAAAWPDAAARRAALDLYGGWRGLCGSLPADGPELLGTAKVFKASYRAYDQRGQRQGLPPGETGRELSASEAMAALGGLRIALEARGLPAPLLPGESS
jgi:hypothetical protein